MSEFIEKYGQYAVIAGASEGVGESFARSLAEKGLDLVLISRTASKLEALAADIRDQTARDIRCLALDLTNPVDLQTIKNVTKDLPVGMFIYNAGSNTMPHQPLIEGELSGYHNVLALNVIGPLELSHHFGGKFKQQQHGGIILLGSMAGLCGAYGNAVYGAAKAFGHNLAEGLWSELEEYGVDVVGLILGLTDTPTLRRTRPGVDLSGASQPKDIVASVLARMDQGPILFPDGYDAYAEKLLKMPRKPLVSGARDISKQFSDGKKVVN